MALSNNFGDDADFAECSEDSSMAGHADDPCAMLSAITEELRSWAAEGPPRNPRASAAQLVTQLETVGHHVAAKLVENTRLPLQVQELQRRLQQCKDDADIAVVTAKVREAKQQAEAVATSTEETNARAALEAVCADLRRAQTEQAAMSLEDMAASAGREAATRALFNGIQARAQDLQAETDDLREENQRLHLQSVTLGGQLREGLPPVSVMCRVRPLHSYSSESKSALHIDLNEIQVEDAGSNRPRKFRVGRVVNSTAGQEEAFAAIAPFVECVSTGGSACIFAYGATGSGKTYTLQGGLGDNGATYVPGLAHHALRRLVEGPGGGPIRIAMLEVYCEQLRDLLGGCRANVDGGAPPNVQCSKRDAQGHMVLDNTRCTVNTFAEAEDILVRGYGARAAGGTLCNERSSRSHVVLFADRMQADLKDSEANCGGRLVLVDLAGSENVQRSGADEDSKLLAEAKAINRSLSALADVVEATAKKQPFVPYRNSKLTMMLEEAFSQAKVLMMVHVSPLVRDCIDTCHSLTFAQRVQAVDFGAQRLRADQEERLRSGYSRARREKEAAEACADELRQKVAQLTEQLHLRAERSSSNLSSTCSGAATTATAGARLTDEALPPSARRRGSGEPQLTQAQQLLPRSCASINTGMRLTGRSPSRRPEGEPKVRLRVPTPMPRREIRDALVAGQDGSDHEEGRTVDSSPRSKVRNAPQRMPVVSETRKTRSGSEDAGSRVLNDITNLPQAQALALDGKESKDLQDKHATLVDRHNEAEKSWPECDEAVVSSPPVDIQTAQVPRGILKQESTRFAAKRMQKLLLREYGGEDSTLGVPGSDVPANGVRRVHWDEDANNAMSPPRWYLRLRSLPSRQDEDAAATQRSSGIRRELQQPRGRVGSSSPTSLTRPVYAAPLDEENLNSLEAGSLAPPRWRR